MYILWTYSNKKINKKIFSKIRQSNEGKKVDTKREELVQFVVRVCSDVFLEVLYWGDRRHLIKLEKIGRRLHWLIDGRFKRAPFLCLDIYINRRVFILKFHSKF